MCGFRLFSCLSRYGTLSLSAKYTMTSNSTVIKLSGSRHCSSACVFFLGGGCGLRLKCCPPATNRISPAAFEGSDVHSVVRTYMKDAGTHMRRTLGTLCTEEKQSVKKSPLCAHIQSDLLLWTISTWRPHCLCAVYLPLTNRRDQSQKKHRAKSQPVLICWCLLNCFWHKLATTCFWLRRCWLSDYVFLEH